VEDKDDQPPYRFTGKVDKLSVRLVPLTRRRKRKSCSSKRPNVVAHDDKYVRRPLLLLCGRGHVCQHQSGE
jgi:hypothetical protein